MAKFTVEEAVEALKGRFINEDGKTSLQISDRTLQETLARKVAKTGDETELTAFIDDIYEDYAVFNRNHIKDVADGIKAKTEQLPPPPKEDGKPDYTAAFKSLMEEQRKMFEDTLKPLREKIDVFEQHQSEAGKAADIAAKKAEMKLTPAWSVDFDNCVQIASLTLGSKATSTEIFEKAKTLFNETLTKRGEVYKPLEGTGGTGHADFSELKKKLEAEKQAREQQKK